MRHADAMALVDVSACTSFAVTRPPRRPASAAKPLSRDLRDSTRGAHVAVELAFTLDARLASRGRYADLLGALRGFYGPLEAALHVLPGWSGLVPAVDVGARRRAFLLDDDLRALGAVPQPRRGAVPPALPTLAHGLGCLYVLEGSALGGRIVARQARAALGEDLPLAFFTTAGRTDLSRDWRALQMTLDQYGTAHGAFAHRAAIDGATQTFQALESWLTDEVPLP